MKMPSLSYITRDILFTSALVIGVFVLMNVQPEKSAEQKEVILRGTLNEMGGAEFVPQGNPRKPYAYIDIQKASDKGWDIMVRTSNLIVGDSFDGYNEDHLAIGYPYLLVDGIQRGRIYGEKYHLPPLPPGEHIISVFFEFPQGGLYRVLNNPIGNSVRLIIEKDGDFTTSTL